MLGRRGKQHGRPELDGAGLCQWSCCNKQTSSPAARQHGLLSHASLLSWLVATFHEVTWESSSFPPPGPGHLPHPVWQGPTCVLCQPGGPDEGSPGWSLGTCICNKLLRDAAAGGRPPYFEYRGITPAHALLARTHPHSQMQGRQENEVQLFAQEPEEPGSVNTGRGPEQVGGTQPSPHAVWGDPAIVLAETVRPFSFPELQVAG